MLNCPPTLLTWVDMFSSYTLSFATLPYHANDPGITTAVRRDVGLSANLSAGALLIAMPIMSLHTCRQPPQ